MKGEVVERYQERDLRMSGASHRVLAHVTYEKEKQAKDRDKLKEAREGQ